jgi:hypothetical protein
MVLKGTAPLARVGWSGATVAAAQPTPLFLHEREADTAARRDGVLWGFATLQGGANALAQILGVWLHTPHDAPNISDIQLQAALVVTPCIFQGLLSTWTQCFV